MIIEFNSDCGRFKFRTLSHLIQNMTIEECLDEELYGIIEKMLLDGLPDDAASSNRSENIYKIINTGQKSLIFRWRHPTLSPCWQDFEVGSADTRFSYNFLDSLALLLARSITTGVYGSLNEAQDAVKLVAEKIEFSSLITPRWSADDDMNRFRPSVIDPEFEDLLAPAFNNIIGYQPCDLSGQSITDTDLCPYEMCSFELIGLEAANECIKKSMRRPGIKMMPFYKGMIEKPELIEFVPVERSLYQESDKSLPFEDASLLFRKSSPENLEEDVHVIEVASLDADRAKNFDTPYLLQFADASYIDCESEELACRYQEFWRRYLMKW